MDANDFFSLSLSLHKTRGNSQKMAFLLLMSAIDVSYCPYKIKTIHSSIFIRNSLTLFHI